jgi:hypothetical protein
VTWGHQRVHQGTIACWFTGKRGPPELGDLLSYIASGILWFSSIREPISRNFIGCSTLTTCSRSRLQRRTSYRPSNIVVCAFASPVLHIGVVCKNMMIATLRSYYSEGRCNSMSHSRLLAASYPEGKKWRRSSAEMLGVNASFVAVILDLVGHLALLPCQYSIGVWIESRSPSGHLYRASELARSSLSFLLFLSTPSDFFLAGYSLSPCSVIQH